MRQFQNKCTWSNSFLTIHDSANFGKTYGEVTFPTIPRSESHKTGFSDDCKSENVDFESDHFEVFWHFVNYQIGFM